MPFGQHLIAADLDIGILFVIAVTSLVTIGLMMGGWASNNKWSMLGGNSLGRADHQLRNPRRGGDRVHRDDDRNAADAGHHPGAGRPAPVGSWPWHCTSATPSRSSCSSCGSPPHWPRETARLSIYPKPRASSSPATPPSTRACATCSSSSPNGPTSSSCAASRRPSFSAAGRSPASPPAQQEAHFALQCPGRAGLPAQELVSHLRRDLDSLDTAAHPHRSDDEPVLEVVRPRLVRGLRPHRGLGRMEPAPSDPSGDWDRYVLALDAGGLLFLGAGSSQLARGERAPASEPVPLGIAGLERRFRVLGRCC